jgi:hypothetical protein
LALAGPPVALTILVLLLAPVVCSASDAPPTAAADPVVADAVTGGGGLLVTLRLASMADVGWWPSRSRGEADDVPEDSGVDMCFVVCAGFCVERFSILLLGEKETGEETIDRDSI